MTISGIGNDLVDIRRIEKSIKKFGDKFLHRCFTEKEIETAKKRKNGGLEISAFAKRFAAKEAIAKAMGTGFSDGIKMKEISIENDRNGKPFAIIKGKALEKLGDRIVHISMSDEYPYAQAFAIIEIKK